MKSIFSNLVAVFVTRTSLVTLCISMFVGLLWNHTTAVAQLSVSFTEVARGDGFGGLSGFSQFQFGRSINDLGTVVFRANLDAGGEEGLFTGNGGGVTTIATASQFGSPSFLNPTIANNGLVLFRGGSDSSHLAVLGGSGGPFTTYASAPVSSPPDPNWFDQVVNLNGTAVIHGGFNGSSRLYLSSGSGGPSLLYDADTLPGIGRFFSSDINESGWIASIVGPDFGQPFELVIGNGGPLTTLVNSSEGLGHLANVSINQSGNVAFGANSSPFGPSHLYQTVGGVRTLIADLSGPFSEFDNFGVSLNDFDDVAFWARLDAGGSGIFMGPDLINDKIIRTGDTLFGSTVTNLEFSRLSLNNNDQLVFHATLANGHEVIVRADFTVVPEPSAFGLGLVATLILTGIAVGRKRLAR